VEEEFRMFLVCGKSIIDVGEERRRSEISSLLIKYPPLIGADIIWSEEPSTLVE
jgi:hypothetical protein